MELLELTLVVNDDHGLVASAGFDLEGPVLDVILNGLLTELATNKSLGVENSVLGVSGDLILGGVTNETLLLSEGDV